MNSSFKTIESRLTGMTAGLWAMGTINAACFAALFTILATR
jgi:hypothetical protein